MVGPVSQTPSLHGWTIIPVFLPILLSFCLTGKPARQNSVKERAGSLSTRNQSIMVPYKRSCLTLATPGPANLAGLTTPHNGRQTGALWERRSALVRHQSERSVGGVEVVYLLDGVNWRLSRTDVFVL
ncbi:hypothetical protein RRG08_054429 [Elysia crispata]|uniref:Uncharacterized protein n=1 Tax=Elysia crispata TaxID=231223 RepID=A0AAE1E5Z7_9GAST|nr:hypothetical protein RRG08_054429 [Elysia crispata]